MNALKKREEGPIQMQTVSPSRVSGYIVAWTVDWGNVIDLIVKANTSIFAPLGCQRRKLQSWLTPNNYLRRGL